MRRVYALAISLALLVATPGLATADPLTRPARNQQAIDLVIQRALSQRGVPFSYGGGGASGPSAPPAPAVGAAPAIPLGTEQLANTGGINPGTGTVLAPPVTALPGTQPAASVVGFDASGLMVYAFAGVGVKLPRSSGEQYAVAQKVLPAQALPGDLIFYGPDGADSVALFIGNGQMVQTTDSGVSVSAVRTTEMTPYLGRIIA